MFKNIKTIFFDFDGTLHDSIRVYAPAFKKAYSYLVEHHYATPRTWKPNEISHWLGFNSVDMWNSFMPELDLDIRKVASNMIGTEMAFQIKSGNGALYPKTLEVLKYLKNHNYTIVFLSNCGPYYKTLVVEQYHLDLYFDDMICSGDFNQIPKFQILGQIKSNYPDDMVIIGDRFHDIEAGSKNKIYTIGCQYGYGNDDELQGADYLIKDISEIATLF